MLNVVLFQARIFSAIFGLHSPYSSSFFLLTFLSHRLISFVRTTYVRGVRDHSENLFLCLECILFRSCGVFIRLVAGYLPRSLLWR